ncbi:MAG: DUF3000 domain-containing protein [Actinomycetota bacterium]|nr:DUF3000 domain-containing protein [Actinomycetota bacterium]
MTEQEAIPEPFSRAMTSLRAVRLRPEVELDEAPAPQRLAPFAVALTADVVVHGDELATGRFVVLHEPDGHETWDGDFRVVTFARASLDVEMATDPVLTGVGWAWLLEALAEHGADFRAPSGTVTRVASESFGAMADRPATAELEVRASWTPLDDDLGIHLAAWSDLLCTAGGLPPVPPGVVPLTQPRRGLSAR